jgi:hypothetical protein
MDNVHWAMGNGLRKSCSNVHTGVGAAMVGAGGRGGAPLGAGFTPPDAYIASIAMSSVPDEDRLISSMLLLVEMNAGGVMRVLLCVPSGKMYVVSPVTASALTCNGYFSACSKLRTEVVCSPICTRIFPPANRKFAVYLLNIVRNEQQHYRLMYVD